MSPKMTYKTAQMSVCVCMRCWHFQNPNTPRPLGRHRWNLVCIFYGLWDKTSSLEFWLPCHAVEMTHPDHGPYCWYILRRYICCINCLFSSVWVSKRWGKQLSVKCTMWSHSMVYMWTTDIWHCGVMSWRPKVIWWQSLDMVLTDRKLVHWHAALLRKQWVCCFALLFVTISQI